MAPVGESIQQGACQSFGAENLSPFFKGQIGGDHKAPVFIGFAYNPRTVKNLGGFKSPAERPNQFRYHSNRSSNLSKLAEDHGCKPVGEC